MELNHIATRACRLSGILREELSLSTGLINRLKRQEALLVNGKPEFTNYPVQVGDTVTVLLDEPSPEYPAEEGELTVLYEDTHLLAVHKPAGMLIHPSHCRNSGTLANLVAGYYKKTGQNCAFHPVTRLDRDTFGIVLLAKSSHAHARMQQTSLQKTYRALVYGQPEAAGSCLAPIARREKPSLLRYVSQDGKPCHTEFRVLQRYEGFALLQLTPITGRTHQLRVHCAHMGHPILGDPQYGSPASQAFSQGLPYQMLWACGLEFVHPITGQATVLTDRTDALAAFVRELRSKEACPE